MSCRLQDCPLLLPCQHQLLRVPQHIHRNAQGVLRSHHCCFSCDTALLFTIGSEHLTAALLLREDESPRLLLLQQHP
jgi:hypothetical protein